MLDMALFVFLKQVYTVVLVVEEQRKVIVTPLIGIVRRNSVGKILEFTFFQGEAPMMCLRCTRHIIQSLYQRSLSKRTPWSNWALAS